MRDNEVPELSARPTDAMRVDWIHERLRDARDAGAAVRKALLAEQGDLATFDHVDRWIGVLGREVELQAVA